MTREEAIKEMLYAKIKLKEANIFPSMDTAIDMAIEALSAEPIYCNECIHQDYCYQAVSYTKVRLGYSEHSANPIEWCSRAERKEE